MQITALSFEFLHKKTDAAVRPWAGVQRASCLWSHTGSVFGVLFVGGSRRSLWPNTLLPLRLKWRRLRLFFELQIVFCIHSLPYNPSSILMQAALSIKSRSCCSPAQIHVWLPSTRRIRLHVLGGAFKVELSLASSLTIPLPCPLELLVPLSQTSCALMVSCTPCLGVCPALLPRNVSFPPPCLVDVLLIFQGQTPCSHFSETCRHRGLVVPFSGAFAVPVTLATVPLLLGTGEHVIGFPLAGDSFRDRAAPDSPLCSQGLKYSPPHAQG